MVKLKSYLGLLSYYSKFLQHLSTTLVPLYKLLKWDEPWQWSEEQSQAFEKSKEPPPLIPSPCPFRSQAPHTLDLRCIRLRDWCCSVSRHAGWVGETSGVLFQVTQADREEVFSDRERGAGMCGGSDSVSLLSLGSSLHSANRSLLMLFNENKLILQQPANRIQHWVWKLVSYEYSIKWRASSQHSNAVALSRLPLPQTPAATKIPAEFVLMVERLDESPVTVKEVARLTRQDPVMARVYCYIQEGWPA